MTRKGIPEETQGRKTTGLRAYAYGSGVAGQHFIPAPGARHGKPMQTKNMTDIANLGELLIDSCQLFSMLEAHELNVLLATANRQAIKARKALCERGEQGNELFIVIEGKLKVRTTSEDGKEVILGYIEAGEVVGEMALLDGQPRSADLVAVQDTDLLAIEQRAFLSFLESHPKVGLGIMQALTQRLRKAGILLEDARFLDLKSRLAKTLYRLAQEHGRTVAGGGIRIDLKISQEELGSLVGATRENVNKLVRAWVDEGVLETSQSTVIVRQPEALLGA